MLNKIASRNAKIMCSKIVMKRERGMNRTNCKTVRVIVCNLCALLSGVELIELKFNIDCGTRQAARHVK